MDPHLCWKNDNLSICLGKFARNSEISKKNNEKILSKEIKNDLESQRIKKTNDEK